MRVLLVDDHELFLEGLRNLLIANGVEVVGAASDGFEALAKARSLRPEVILMDIRMPRCDGLQATRMIKAEHPEIKIVILSVSDDDDDLFGAVRSGASGYLLKSAVAKDFFSLLEALAEGEVPLSKGLSARMLAEFARQLRGHEARSERTAVHDDDNLTGRQIAILAMVAQGLTYSEIGAALCITEHTVKYHVRQSIDRLHLKNRAQLIAYAHESGLLPGGRMTGEGGE